MLVTIEMATAIKANVKDKSMLGLSGEVGLLFGNVDDGFGVESEVIGTLAGILMV